MLDVQPIVHASLVKESLTLVTAMFIRFIRKTYYWSALSLAKNNICINKCWKTWTLANNTATLKRHEEACFIHFNSL